MLQEAKRNAKSNDLVLNLERAPNSKPNRCAIERLLTESGARLPKQGGRQGGREEGRRGEKNILIL